MISHLNLYLPMMILSTYDGSWIIDDMVTTQIRALIPPIPRHTRVYPCFEREYIATPKKNRKVKIIT